MASKKMHNEECRARLYGKFEEEKHAKYARVREERLRAHRDRLPMPTHVDIDASDYENWLMKEIQRERKSANDDTPPVGGV